MDSFNLSEPIQSLSPEWLNQERRNNEFHSTKRRPENSKVLTKSKSSPDNGIHKIEKKENSFDKDFVIKYKIILTQS